MAKNITIHNPVPYDRQGWVECVVPEDLGATAKFTSGTIVWPAVRGRQRYSGTTGAWVYRIKATMSGNQIASGSLAADAAPPGLPKAFALHPWVEDDLNALIPTPAFPDATLSPNWAFKLATTIDSSLAHQMVQIRRHNASLGMIFDCFMCFKEDDPTVDIYAAITWSTRKDPALTKRGEGLFLITQELFALDTATRLGASPAIYMGPLQQIPGNPQFEGQWKTRIKFNPGWQDGSAYAFTGRLCCFVGPATSILSEDPETWNLSVSSIQAGRVAPMVAVCTQWGTAGVNWLGGSIPRIRGGAGPAATIAANELLTWAKLMPVPNDWHAERPIGLAPDAYRSGNQEDFGHTHGASALAGASPEWILEAKHSIYAEFLRGGMNYEDAKGELHLLLASEHPQWHCWGGVTHWSTSQSPDRIGKKNEVYGERESVSGWVMEDDQHYSRRNRNTYRGLTDDPLWDLRDQSLVEIDTSAVQDSASRAYGRQLLEWADMYNLAVGNTALQNKILACVDRRINMANNAASMKVAGNMKVLQVQNDPRKEIYAIIPVEGQHANSASMWETAIAAVGFARWQGRLSASTTLTKLLTTLALCGCWEDTGDSTWYTVDDILYQGGAELDPSRYFLGSPQVILGRGNSVNGGNMSNTHDWTLVGIMLAAKLLAPGAAKTKAANCVAWWTGNQEATARDTAEWWSCVDAIPVV